MNVREYELNKHHSEISHHSDAIDLDTKTHKNLYTELNEIDEILKKTMDVEVPSELESKIMLQIQRDIIKQKKKSVFRRNIAASIIFALGLTISLIDITGAFQNNAQAADNINNVAISHHLMAFENFEKKNHVLTIDEVNLAFYNTNLELINHLSADILGIYNCNLNSARVMHFLLQKEESFYDVYFFPENYQRKHEFISDDLISISFPMHQDHSMVIVGRNINKINNLADEIKFLFNRKI